MKKISIFKVIRGFNSSTGRTGTLIIFTEKIEKGDRKDKNIMFWSNNSDYKLESKNGWTADEEGNVSEPIISEEDKEDRKFGVLKSLGLTVSI